MRLLLVRIAACHKQMVFTWTQKRICLKKRGRCLRQRFFPFLCHTATAIYILCSPTPFISRLILPTPCTTNWKHIKNKNIKMKSQRITTSKILFYLFYFILFYFILFYFILFYFILFCFILFYFVLFYFILFYFILFYFITYA